MLTRLCAGGVVFCNDKVLILQNDKNEWVLPKGVIRNDGTAREVALIRVKHESGVEGNILSPAGETSYEFFSITRKMPVCNRIDWFIMEAEDEQVKVSKEDGFIQGGFFPVDEALEMITYSQDKSLVSLSYRKYNFFRKQEMTSALG